MKIDYMKTNQSFSGSAYLKKLALIAVIVCFSAVVSAAQPEFSFIKAGQSELAHEQVAGDFSGYAISASYEVEAVFYVAASFESHTDLGLDMQTKTIGLGYFHRMTEDSLIFMQVDSVGVVFSRPNSGQFDEQGNRFSLGLKYRPWDMLEIGLTARRLNAGEVDPDYGDYLVNSGLAELTIHLTSQFSIYADYEESEETKRQSVGLRYNF